VSGKRLAIILAAIVLALALLRKDGIGWAEDGVASWYGGPDFHGQKTASGEIFDESDPTTAASTSYPLGTRVHVAARGGEREITVRINDTGVFTRPHLLDLSKAAFAELADPDAGVIDVRVEVIEQEGETGDD